MCNFIHLSSVTYLRSNLRYFLCTVREIVDMIQSSLLNFTFWQSISNSLSSDSCILSNIFSCALFNFCRKCFQKVSNFAMMDLSSTIILSTLENIGVFFSNQAPAGSRNIPRSQDWSQIPIPEFVEKKIPGFLERRQWFQSPLLVF